MFGLYVFVLILVLVHTGDSRSYKTKVPVQRAQHATTKYILGGKFQKENIKKIARFALHGTKHRLSQLTLSGKLGSSENSNCWPNMEVSSFYKNINDLQSNNQDLLCKFDGEVGTENFTQKMLGTMLAKRGASGAALHTNFYQSSLIPAGFNLGGYSLIKLPGSVLFFYRMKLRNQTLFEIKTLNNNLQDMALNIDMSLNDLHLHGAYERALIVENDPSNLFYAPNFGKLEFLLKDTRYIATCRYRLVKDRLRVVTVNSGLLVDDDVLLTYLNQKNQTVSEKVAPNLIDDFILKMQNDLDNWLKDYFNYYLAYEPLKETELTKSVWKYDLQKTAMCNEYMDKVLDKLNDIVRTNYKRVKVPSFNITSVDGVQVKLFNGVLVGLDSMYRRTATTTSNANLIRMLDSQIGFNSLQLIYKYQVSQTKWATLQGSLMLDSDELAVALKLKMVDNPETMDLDFRFLENTRPESLIIEGEGVALLGKIRHIVENHVIAIMSQNVYYYIKILGSLVDCTPALVPEDAPDNTINDADSNK